MKEKNGLVSGSLDVACWRMASRKIYPRASPWNLWISPYMDKEGILDGPKCDLGKDLRGWVYLGFSEWAVNPVINVLLRVRPREIWETDVEAMWPQRQWLDWCGHRWRNAHGHQRLLQAAKDDFSPRASRGSAVLPRTERIRLLFSATKFVVIVTAATRNWIWWPSKQSWARGLFLSCKETQPQFSSVSQSCPTLCDPMNSSTPGLPVHHQLPEST